MQHRVVVGGPPRWPWVALSALGVLALLGWMLALGLMFNFLPAPMAFLHPDTKATDAHSDRINLRKALDEARLRAESCEMSSTVSVRGQEIDVQACEMLQDSIARLEAEGAQLREQLAFYRSIAAPEQTKAGVRIVSMSLLRKGQPLGWGYELTVLQPVLNAEPLNASYRLSIAGKLGNKSKTLTMAPVVTPAGGTSEFLVKTFATLTGAIQLPPDFKPARLEVTIEVVGSKGYAGKINETFSWSKLVAAAK